MLQIIQQEEQAIIMELEAEVDLEDLVVHTIGNTTTEEKDPVEMAHQASYLYGLVSLRLKTN